MSHILVVEDETELAELIKDYLHAANYQVTLHKNGEHAKQWLAENKVDLIILDLMLPGIDGVELCRQIRKKSDVPIIMATAKVEEVDRILGLNIGADDYICKPYSPRELVARINAILRRINKSDKAELAIRLDSNTLTLALNGLECELTVIEFKLLELLLKEPGKIFSRQFIMDNIYNDYRIVSDRTVDSHIKKLRKKISELDSGKQYIHSIYGAGYKFEDQSV